MSTRYLSFISGIVIASLTWAFSLYLYSRLSQNADVVNPTMLTSDSSKLLKESVFPYKTFNDRELGLRDNRVLHSDKETASNKGAYNLKGTYFKNSDKLVQQLQPVPVKPAVTLGQGMFILYIFKESLFIENIISFKV